MMKFVRNITTKTAARSSKALIWVLSFLLAVFVMVQIAVGIGVLWLNSDSGQGFVSAQLQELEQTSGYKIDISKFAYAFPQGLKLESLSVESKGKQIAEIKNLSARPVVSGSNANTLKLSVSVDYLGLYHLPETQEENTATAGPVIPVLEPFSVPDIYFKQIKLDRFNIDDLNISGDAFGVPMQLSPSLEMSLTLDETIDLAVSFLNKQEESSPLWLPKELRVNGNLNPATLETKLQELSAENPAYDIQITGGMGLGQSGVWDVDIQGSVHDFAKLAEGVEGNAELQATLSGISDTLAINANGVLSMPMLKQRELGDVAFTFEDTDIFSAPLGHAALKTTYKEQSVELASDLDLNEEILSLSNIEGRAPDITLNGVADINTSTMLVDGKANLSIADLSRYGALIGTNVKGKGEAELILKANEALQQVDAKINAQDLAYEGISLKSTKVDATIPDIQNVWPTKLNLDAKGLRISNDIVLTTVNATIQQKDENDHYALSLKTMGKVFEDVSLDGKATLSGIKTGEIKAQDIDAKLVRNRSFITLGGRVDMKTLDVVLKTQQFKLSDLPVSLPDRVQSVVLNGQASISGEMAAPSIEADITANPVDVIKDEKLTFSAKASYSNDSALININGDGQSVEKLEGSVQVPMHLSLVPFEFDLSPASPLQGSLDLKAKAEALGALFLPVGHRINGPLSVQGKITGNVSKPDVLGQINFSGGSYEYDVYEVGLYDINLDAGLTSEEITINTLTANDGKNGKLQGSGKIDIASMSDTNIKLNLSDFELLGSDQIKGLFSAVLELKEKAQGYLLKGKVALGEVNIAIPERFQSRIPTLNIVEKDKADSESDVLKTVQVDIKVSAENKVFVRGWGLDAEFGADIDVSGTLDNPQFNGNMESRRGRYDEFGRRFDLERAYLRFQGTIPPSPYLDIVATTDASDINASVILSGPVTEPSIKLTSTPALPQDEVLSRILFGKNLENITAFQAIQLKQTLDRFTGNGGGGLDPLGAIRDLTGVDDINVDTDDEGEASVGVGKYLADGVYLELEKGAGEASGAAKIQVEVTPNINVESEVGQDAQAGAGVLWRWDY